MTKYAFNINAAERVQYVGRIVEETTETITLNAFRALSLILIGHPEETDELITVPRNECRIFASEVAMLDACRTAFRRYRVTA